MKSSKDNPYHVGFLVLLVGCLAIRLPALPERLSLVNEWGQAIFLVFARNYNRMGLTHGGVPIFSLLEDQPVIYANHPWGASLLMGMWTGVWGVSETSFHSLALLFSLATLLAVYLIGCRLWSPKVALGGAIFFGLSPLSLHLGLVYGMEMVCLTFLLFFLYFADSWHEKRTKRELLLASLSLIMAQACDVYALLFTPFLFLLTLLSFKQDRKRSLVFFGWTLTPYIVTAIVIGILYSQGFLNDAFVGGAGRGGSFWSYWFRAEFWIDTFGKMRMGYTTILPILACLGLVVCVKKRPKTWVTWAALWLLPITQLLLCARWHAGHNYFIQFFGPALCLQSAALLLDQDKLPNWRKAATVICLSVFCLQSWDLNQSYWFNRTYADNEMAGQIRKLTTDQDLLMGLPPKMSYYIDRKYMIPYFSLVRSDYNNEEERFFEVVRSYSRDSSYERVILFTQFLRPPWVDIDSIDYSKALDGLPDYRRKTKPGQDPQVWERVTSLP